MDPSFACLQAAHVKCTAHNAQVFLTQTFSNLIQNLGVAFDEQIGFRYFHVWHRWLVHC